MKKVPLSVKLIANYCFLSAFAGLVLMAFFFFAIFAVGFAFTDSSAGTTSYLGIIFVDIAVSAGMTIFYIAAGIGLLILQNWARILLGILSLLMCIISILGINYFAGRQVFIGLPLFVLLANLVVGYFAFFSTSIKNSLKIK